MKIMELKDLRSGLQATQGQEMNTEGEVAKRRRGRPERPHMLQTSLRIPKMLNSELVRFCKQAGIGKSAFICASIKAMMSDKVRRNEMLVDKFL